jgi:hypothetical protein
LFKKIEADGGTAISEALQYFIFKIFYFVIKQFTIKKAPENKFKGF